MNRIRGKEGESEENKCQVKKSNKRNIIKWKHFQKIVIKRNEKERKKTWRKSFYINFRTFHLSWRCILLANSDNSDSNEEKCRECTVKYRS
jgi:hypothetical protein